MAWVTPKTDWQSTTSEGIYTGDYFIFTDFNRIKNNLEYLHDLAVQYYPAFPIESLGNDRTVMDFVYADEFNKLESNFSAINEHSLNRDYGTAPFYVPNGPFPDYSELNRLESAMLDIYEGLSELNTNDRRKFVWNFGIKEGKE